MMNKKENSGQSLVEFALIFPLIVLLLLGLFDLGRAVFYYSSISNMVREGARFSIVDSNAKVGPFQDNVVFMNDYSFAIPDVSTASINNCAYPGPCVFRSQDQILTITIQRLNGTVTNEFVKVEAVYFFKPITFGIARLFGSSGGIDLVAQSTMRTASQVRQN